MINGNSQELNEITAIVLAGGKYLRLGKNKALEIIGGKTLIERTVERVKPLSDRILVVTSSGNADFPIRDKVEILIDLYPEKGPLAGIYTGLKAARTPYSLVVACDMPFLNRKLLEYMIGLAPGYDAVVPRLGERLLEPLHAVYASCCQEQMKTRLESGKLSLNSFIDALNVRYIEREECRRFDPELLSFFNINYPADLEKAIKLAAEDDLRNAPVRPKP